MRFDCDNYSWYYSVTTDGDRTAYIQKKGFDVVRIEILDPNKNADEADFEPVTREEWEAILNGLFPALMDLYSPGEKE